jgi:hypothetical protein
MAGISEDEAFYKIAQAGEFIRKFETDKQLIDLIKMMIEGGLTEQSPASTTWTGLKGLLSMIGIQINKPSEPIGDIRELSTSNINWRREHWECSDPYHYYRDGTKHCTECGKCRKSKGDGHQCKCGECHIEHSGKNCPNCGR